LTSKENREALDVPKDLWESCIREAKKQGLEENFRKPDVLRVLLRVARKESRSLVASHDLLPEMAGGRGPPTSDGAPPKVEVLQHQDEAQRSSEEPPLKEGVLVCSRCHSQYSSSWAHTCRDLQKQSGDPARDAVNYAKAAFWEKKGKVVDLILRKLEQAEPERFLPAERTFEDPYDMRNVIVDSKGAPAPREIRERFGKIV
jgi:hypothetical protein